MKKWQLQWDLGDSVLQNHKKMNDIITLFFFLSFVGARYNYEQNVHVAIQLYPHHLHKRDLTLASLSARFNSSIEPIGELQDYFLMTIPKSERNIETLLENQDFRWMSIQKPEKRLFKRSNMDLIKKKYAMTDPGLDQQWHLVMLEC